MSELFPKNFIIQRDAFDWHVIGIENGIATLLMRTDIFAGSYYSDKLGDSYRDSFVRKRLNGWILETLIRDGYRPIPTEISDSGSEDSLWELSAEEFEKLPKRLKVFPRRWWLRDKGSKPGTSLCVNRDGSLEECEDIPETDTPTLRPAMRMKLEDLIVREEKKPEPDGYSLWQTVNYAGYEWFIVARGKSEIAFDDEYVTLLSKDSLGETEFDDDSNDYSSSHIRRYLKHDIRELLGEADLCPTRITLAKKDDIWLLTVRDASRLPEHIRDIGKDWWLRSPSKGDSRHALCVPKSGFDSEYSRPVSDNSVSVRPAIRVSLSKLKGNTR